MKIGYFADGPWSHQALNNILNDVCFQIAFICVRFHIPDPILSQLAKELKIPLLTHANVNSVEFINRVQEFNCDIFVSMSFDQIFKKEIIQLTPQKIINCHAGLLPFYRGRNILNWALINDEKEFGITVHYVDEGIDTGDIILQQKNRITDADNYKTLLEKAYVQCAELLYDSLKLILQGKVQRVSQNSIHPLGSYCGQRKKGDEVINWNQTSRQIFNFIRAICRPGPMAMTYLDGVDILINSSKYFKEAPQYMGIPGQILTKTKDGFLVKTQDSFVEIKEITSEKKIRVGDRFR